MIPFCKDPALQALKGQGYSIVRLPKADLRPSQLLVRKGSNLRRLGELISLFSPDRAAPAPTVSADNPAPGISGTQSADLDIGVGLNILGGLISALGGSTLALTLGYSRARSMQFEFSDVLENNIETTLLDQFLAAATIHPFAQAVSEMLDADDVYVVTSTLKARKVNVVAKDEQKQTLGIDVPVVSQAIGANLKVSGVGAGNVFVTYEGQVPLAFGFQAVRLIFDNGRYRRMKIEDADAVALEGVGDEIGDGQSVYLSEDRMIPLDL